MVMKLRLTALLTSIFIISACGGGGGSSAPAPVFPSVSISSGLSVNGGESITVSATISDSQSRISSRSWEVSTSGKSFNFSSNGNSITFTAPKNYQDESASVTYKYTYNSGTTGAPISTASSASATVSIKAVIPDIPTNITFETGSQAANVFWTASQGANKYTFYYSETNSTITQSDAFFEIEGNERDSVRIIEIPNDIKSTFAFSASNAAGESELSSTFEITPVGPSAEFTNQPNLGNFDLTKFDIYGNETTSDWSCVQDNTTGLMWEVKKDTNKNIGDDGLQDLDDLYTYYDSSNIINGVNDFGDKNAQSLDCSFASESSNTKNCNTEDFLSSMNTGKDLGKAFCGRSNWRIPSILEVIQLLNLSERFPNFPDDYFTGSNITIGGGDEKFWVKEQPNEAAPSGQYAVDFDSDGGISILLSKTKPINVRAVSSDDNTANQEVNFSVECFEHSAAGQWRDYEYSQEDVKEFASNKANQTGEDWRVASIKELAHFHAELPLGSSLLSSSPTPSGQVYDYWAYKITGTDYYDSARVGQISIFDTYIGTYHMCLSKY